MKAYQKKPDNRQSKKTADPIELKKTPCSIFMGQPFLSGFLRLQRRFPKEFKAYLPEPEPIPKV